MPEFLLGNFMRINKRILSVYGDKIEKLYYLVVGYEAKAKGMRV